MNELIKIRCNNEIQTTSARDLWEFLGRPYTEFPKWFNQFKDYGFSENQDYRELRIKIRTSHGAEHDAIDYEITIEMAKELAMLQKTEKGKQARQYFIEIEKAWNSPEIVMSRALKLADKKIAMLEEERQKLIPKAEAFDAFISGENYQDMNTVAKAIGWGRNRLFAELRNRRVLMRSNRPYQEYIDRGYFVVKEKPIQMGGQIINKVQTYVTAKGVEWLRRQLAA